jgi:hypothetical protein
MRTPHTLHTQCTAKTLGGLRRIGGKKYTPFALDVLLYLPQKRRMHCRKCNFCRYRRQRTAGLRCFLVKYNRKPPPAPRSASVTGCGAIFLCVLHSKIKFFCAVRKKFLQGLKNS